MLHGLYLQRHRVLLTNLTYRSAPPSHSRPEAANFETGHYGFEEEKKEFKPPQKYPEPPKDMWYQVPKTKPTEAPKAIFPWEVDQRKRTTTRKFAEDDPPSPASGTFSPREVEWNQSSGGMEKYIRDIMAQSELPKGKQPDVTSPGARRESLVFTGLPDMQDRPSLPVTPAPGRTNTFWGDDEGSTSPDVSDQAQWVCPSCGFASADPKPFVSARDPMQRAHDPAADKHESNSPIINPGANLETLARPELAKTERSSATSVLSDTSTVVALHNALQSHLAKIDANPEPASPVTENTLPPHLRPVPLPAQKTGQITPHAVVVEPSSPLIEAVPVAPPSLLESPTKSLPPPAWLTAAVTEIRYTALR